MDKKSFIVFTDMYEPIRHLTLEQKGMLFDTMFAYVDNRELPALDSETRMAWEFFRLSLDRNADKWNSIRMARSAAGKKHTGNQYTRNKMEQNGTNGTNGTVSVSVSDSVSVNANVSVTPHKDKSLFGVDNNSADYDFSEYNAGTMKGQQLMQVLGVNEEQLGMLLKEMSIEWAIRGRTEHQDRTDFDMHLRNTLLKWRESGKMAKVISKSGNVMLGYGERIENGRRTYGTGEYTVPMDAPKRPGSGWFWNPTQNRWEM